MAAEADTRSLRSFRPFGFFAENGRPGDELPSVRDAVFADGSQADIERIVRYMHSGAVLLRPVVVFHDVFDSSAMPVQVQDVVYFDGTWCWPRSVVHFIERYDLRVPDDFVNHMRARDWRAPHRWLAHVAVAEDVIPSLTSPPPTGAKPWSHDAFLADFFAGCADLSEVTRRLSGGLASFLASLGFSGERVGDILITARHLRQSDSVPRFTRHDGKPIRVTATEADSLRPAGMFVINGVDEHRIPVSWDDEHIVWVLNPASPDRASVEVTHWRQEFGGS